MDIEYKFLVRGIICLVAMFVIIIFLNKDYNLNGAKRMLSTSKYGRIAYWASFFLIIWFTQSVQAFIDFLIASGEFVLSTTVYNLLFWLGVPLLGFIFVGSIIFTTYLNYKTRKRDGIKYDKNDV